MAAFIHSQRSFINSALNSTKINMVVQTDLSKYLPALLCLECVSCPSPAHLICFHCFKPSATSPQWKKCEINVYNPAWHFYIAFVADMQLYHKICQWCHSVKTINTIKCLCDVCSYSIESKSQHKAQDANLSS